MGLSNLQSCSMNFTAYKPAVVTKCNECDMQLLKQKLSTYGLTLVLAPPDGDCCFSALKDFLTLAGFENREELTVEAVATKLTRFFVQELLGECWTHDTL